MNPFASDQGHSIIVDSSFVCVSYRNGVATVRPIGPGLGEREAIIIASEVRPVMDQFGGALRRMVLDLSDVKLISSFGLGLCIDLRNSARTLNATTVVFGLSDELADLFKMMKVDRLYTIVKTVRELALAIAA